MTSRQLTNLTNVKAAVRLAREMIYAEGFSDIYVADKLLSADTIATKQDAIEMGNMSLEGFGYPGFLTRYKKFPPESHQHVFWKATVELVDALDQIDLNS